MYPVIKMAGQTDIVNRAIELIELIQELLFGFGYEDFRINRKLKIEVSGFLQDLLEELNINTDYFMKHYPDYNWTAVIDFYSGILVNEAGISEEAVWKFCKQNLRALLKLLKA